MEELLIIKFIIFNKEKMVLELMSYCYSNGKCQLIQSNLNYLDQSIINFEIIILIINIIIYVSASLLINGLESSKKLINI
jgi:hypothetical protein